MIIKVNDIITDEYPIEYGFNMFGIKSVSHLVNFVKGLEILVFLFSDNTVSQWVCLNSDIILDWTDEVNNNTSNGFYSEERSKFLLSPMPEKHKNIINTYLKYRGIDFIFDKIQENYNQCIFEDGEEEYLKFGKDHCRACINNIVDMV